MSDEVSALKARVAALQAEVQQLKARLPSSSPPFQPPSSSPPPMSDEVVDSNPFSRLMALQRMGVVSNYASIRLHSVLIVGIGGVGSVCAEMLCRCGVGRLLLFDYDRVHPCNLNRLFFTPDQAGLPKVIAARDTLHAINPTTVVDPYDVSITSLDHYDTLLHAISTGSVDSTGPVSLVLCCVDNYEARLTVNTACLQLNQVWMESGVSEDALNGHIQTLIPGRTACYACAPPLTVQSPMAMPLHRPGVCAASLPTTMALIAALLVQNALKWMLSFGRVTAFQGYSGEVDGFERWRMAVNAECASQECRARQAEWVGKEGWEEEQERKEREREERRTAERRKAREHEVNEWSIELVESSSDPPPDHPSSTLTYEFDCPLNEPLTEPAVTDTGELSDLLAQLQRVQQ